MGIGVRGYIYIYVRFGVYVFLFVFLNKIDGIGPYILLRVHFLVRKIDGIGPYILLRVHFFRNIDGIGPLQLTVCPSGLRGWTQVPLAQAAWVQIPQLSFFITKPCSRVQSLVVGSKAL